ncbi:hypothetical protein GXM_01298 [Nostoc sphaeroides CCNUC1]|uniref:Uncharacterized protein n=1 Tax=Nostoc sphaeroides CCNUC1 TaxID=2653204 RepID=A0A5P8VTR0_9NOSO|nr:hypothetical protein GXM_01298 [Nostoc sphaeroides CCNUC1]
MNQKLFYSAFQLIELHHSVETRLIASLPIPRLNRGLNT